MTAAERVLAQVETGFMRLVETGDGAFNAWIATKRPPTSWRERADLDSWAVSLAELHRTELAALQAQLGARGETGREAIYRRIGEVSEPMMAFQLDYPADAALGGCTVQTYRDVLAVLIGWALQKRDRGEPVRLQARRSLVKAISSALEREPTSIEEALAGFTLDRDNADYHAAVPGVAAAPLVRVGPDALLWSRHGLLTEPLLFLTRELRRREPQAYQNIAYLREAVFRHDLYALFRDKRFVTSAGRLELRRQAGDVRTDIDAVVFDRKSGTLAIFELKSQDPFARLVSELTRQRDNVLYANRQISGVLDWMKRHGADELLARVDSRVGRTFRVQKVFPFVLGRNLVHFNDGPAPDGRAAWGTWPQVLRLLGGQPVRATDANPIASLFARLSKDAPALPLAESPRPITLSITRLTVFPSYAAFEAGTHGESRSRDTDCG